MTTTTLSAFLLAQIEADETAAREVFVYHSSPWSIHPGPAGWSVVRSEGVVVDDFAGDGESVGHDSFVFQMDTTSTAEHIARHDPAHVLAVCAAHKAIVEAHGPSEDYPVFSEPAPYGPTCAACVAFHADTDCEHQRHPCPTLRALASAYSDRGGFDERWRS